VTGVIMVTTENVFMETRPAASLHVRSAADDIARTTVTYTTSSAPEMHTAKLKAGAENGSVRSKNNMMKGTMTIMVLPTINLTKSGHQKQDTSQEASRYIP
jgi:hypothetical protein